MAAHEIYTHLLGEYLDATELLMPQSRRLATSRLKGLAMKPDRLERDIHFRSLSAKQREQLMIQVAKRDYHLDMTMSDLSTELGLTRWQASRLLTEAKETGLVRIEIVPHTLRLPGLESRLESAFELKDAVVVPSSHDQDSALALDSVARAAGQYLSGLGKIPAIGISWGRTMTAVARRLPPYWYEGVEVVLLNGSMNVRSSGPQTNNVAELFASAGNARPRRHQGGA